MLLECVKGGSEKTAISGYPTFLPDVLRPTKTYKFNKL